MDRIDDRISRLVVDAAAAAPDRIHDLSRIRDRARVLRRRRVLAAAAAVAVTAVVAVPAWLNVQRGPSTVEPPAASATPREWSPWPGTSAQRLIGVIERPSFPGTPVFAEVGATGKTHVITPPAGLVLEQVVAGPDGGLALLAEESGKDNPDGADCAPDLKRHLILRDRDGRESLRRDIHRPCRRERLIGVNDTDAYLLRDRTIVAHALATGVERDIRATTHIAWLGFNDSTIIGIEPNGISTGDTQPCGRMGSRIWTYHVGTAELIEHREQSVDVCDEIASVTASPDGRLVAFLEKESTGVVMLRMFHMGVGAALPAVRVADDHQTLVTGAVWPDSGRVWVVTHDLRREAASRLIPA